MSTTAPPAGSVRPVLLALCLTALAAVPVSGSLPSPVADGPSGSPGPVASTATPAATASPGMTAAPLPSVPAGVFPLPAQVVSIPADIPTVSLTATSEPGLEVGVSIDFELGHCGLLSPVDLDGSLWQPVGGVAGSGGPIDGDADIGELINATPGQFTLLDAWSARFTSANGVVVVFVRAPGALDYPLCM